MVRRLSKSEAAVTGAAAAGVVGYGCLAILAEVFIYLAIIITAIWAFFHFVI